MESLIFYLYLLGGVGWVLFVNSGDQRVRQRANLVLLLFWPVAAPLAIALVTWFDRSWLANEIAKWASKG